MRSSSWYCFLSLHILLMFWFLFSAKFANMIMWWYTRFDVIHHITLQQPACSCPRLFHCYDNNNDSTKDSSRKSRNRQKKKNCVQSDDNVAHMQTKLNAHKTPCFVIGIESWTKQNQTKQIKERKKQHTHIEAKQWPAMLNSSGFHDQASYRISSGISPRAFYSRSTHSKSKVTHIYGLQLRCSTFGQTNYLSKEFKWW